MQITVTEATYFTVGPTFISLLYIAKIKKHIIDIPGCSPDHNTIVRNSTVYRDTVLLLRWLLHFFMTRILTNMTMISETRC